MGIFERLRKRLDSIRRSTEGKKCLSVRSCIRDFKSGIIKTRANIIEGDPKAWYRFWMGALFFFVGLSLLSVVIIDFIFTLTSFRAQQTRPAISVETNRTLPPGDYSILNLYISTTLGKLDEPSEAVSVCAMDGGVVVLALLPEGVHLPVPLYSQDSYFLRVGEDGTWDFIKTNKFFSIEMAKELSSEKKTK